MKVLRPDDYRVMPWKNGGGTTTELYAFPTAPPFQWRVSIAEVSRDGPFSRFEGYDRQIMTVTGNGVMLEGGPHGPIDVTARFEPRGFSGDWNISGRLVDGPVQDFNLITRRASCTGRLRSESPRHPQGAPVWPGHAIHSYSCRQFRIGGWRPGNRKFGLFGPAGIADTNAGGDVLPPSDM